MGKAKTKVRAATAAKTSSVTTASRGRKLRTPKYKSFHLSKRIKHPQQLPSAWKITKTASGLLWRNWKLLLGIVIIYGILNLILVRGFSGGADLGSLKDSLDQIFNGNWGHVASSLTVFAVLVTSSGNTSSAGAGVYQFFLVIIVSLAVIWTLRQVLAGADRLRIRDSYYKGIYPLIPFILVLVVIGLELIPLLVGSTLYSLVVNNGIAVGALEKTLWAALFAFLALLSLYMICSSIFALYIVTLPDMTPMKALKSARELVRLRRWTVLRKVLFLPLILLIAAAIIMLPIIIFATPAAAWVFFVLTMIGIAAIHSYMYTLYRELLV